MVNTHINSVNLRSLFLSLQSQMIMRLGTNREFIEHPTIQGDSTELRWKEMLQTYLPARYKVKRAQVMDSNGRLSEQIDIVICDQQYSPILFEQDAAIYVPAESVYAVIEVKPNLNKGMVKAASKKAKSVRELTRTSANIYDYRGKNIRKKNQPILAGIVTLSSDWNPPFGSPFKDTIKQQADIERLDLGCVLNQGAFAVKYGQMSPKIYTSQRDDALIRFFFTLLSSLQRMGTAPAIEYNKYSLSLI